MARKSFCEVFTRLLLLATLGKKMRCCLECIAEGAQWGVPLAQPIEWFAEERATATQTQDKCRLYPRKTSRTAWSPLCPLGKHKRIDLLLHRPPESSGVVWCSNGRLTAAGSGCKPIYLHLAGDSGVVWYPLRYTNLVCFRILMTFGTARAIISTTGFPMTLVAHRMFVRITTGCGAIIFVRTSKQPSRKFLHFNHSATREYAPRPCCFAKPC